MPTRVPQPQSPSVPAPQQPQNGGQIQKRVRAGSTDTSGDSMRTRAQLDTQDSKLERCRSGRRGRHRERRSARDTAARPRQRRARTLQRRSCRSARRTSCRSGRGTIVVGPIISGELKAEHEATVRAELGGSMVEVTVEEAQPVQKGALLGRIETRTLEDAKQSAQSAVRSAENQLAVARREVGAHRAAGEGRRAGGARSRPGAEQRHGRRGAACRCEGASRAAPTAALGDTVIRAPIQGIVSRRSCQRRRRRQLRDGALHDHRSLVDAARSRRCRPTICGRCVSARRSSSPSAATTDVPGTHRAHRAAGRRDDAAGADLRGDSERRRPARRRPVRRRPRRQPVRRPASSCRPTPSTPTDADAVGAARDGRQDRAGRTSRSACAIRAPSACKVASGLNEGDMLLRGASQGITPGTPVQVSHRRKSRAADMFISDTAIKRPVLTVVAMLMLVVFGIVALLQLDTDEYPGDRRAGRRRGDSVSRRVARRRRARGHRSDRGGDLRHQRHRPHAVELARQLRQHHRRVRLREGPAAGDAGDSRRDLGHPQRPAAGDGGADPHAVRSGGSADRVADAVVAGADRRRADAHRRPRHHAPAARHPRRGAGQSRRAASSASWSSRFGRATCRRPASASAQVVQALQSQNLASPVGRLEGRARRADDPAEGPARLAGRLQAARGLAVARPHRPARRRGRRARRAPRSRARRRSTTTRRPSASTSSSPRGFSTTAVADDDPRAGRRDPARRCRPA